MDQQSEAPYPVPLLGAGFMALRREVFTAVGGFDGGMIRYGMEDPELCIRLWTRGYECLIVPTLEVAHLARDTPPDYQIDWEAGLHNILRLAFVHFGVERMRRTIAALTEYTEFAAALTRLSNGDAWQRRAAILAERCYDDDWFFARFNMG